MAHNTCYTSILIAGDPDELKNLDARISEALSAPGSGEPGGSAARITGHVLQGRLLHVETESEDHPRLKALDDLMKRHAPSGAMLFFASGPTKGLYVTNGEDDGYATVSFDSPVDYEDSKVRELDGWTSVWEQCDLLTGMALKLGMDESSGFDAVAKAFMAAYPVHVNKYVHMDIEQYLE